MKFSTAAVGAILSASAVVAAPGTARRQARAAERMQARAAERLQARRQDTNITGHGNIALAANSLTEPLTLNSNNSHVEYSSNWAGAVLDASGYTSVTGTFTVPTPSVPSGGSSRTEYAASAWVGLDGYSCTTAILQTGVDFYVEGTEVGFDAWYEWYPDYAYDFSGITIEAGDEITVTVTATSLSAGTAVVDNLTKGTTVTHTFTSSEVEGDLCEYNAEWIVEDFTSGSSLIPFADFGTVTFTDASATQDGSSVGVSDAIIIDIEQDNEVLTDCSVSGDSEVTCTYTG